MTQDFSLIETILWENGSFFLLGRHLARLEKSSEYFSFLVDFSSIVSLLEDTGRNFDLKNKYRVRLLVNSSGNADISSTIVSSIPQEPVRVKFSDELTDENDIFLAHKTTKRELYDRSLSSCRAEGYFEILFTNKNGELTEGAISNIIIKKGGIYLTPPLSSGVLPGTYREYLLRSKKIPLREEILRKEDVLSAEGIFIVNSLIKMVAAKL
jgi:para-aminobenzoate synthetase / 4-amino-4-deoxychorismate lyase